MNVPDASPVAMFAELLPEAESVSVRAPESQWDSSSRDFLSPERQLSLRCRSVAARSSKLQ